jgi:septal ring factor EnvC (AmiA/AmiB activator)
MVRAAAHIFIIVFISLCSIILAQSQQLESKQEELYKVKEEISNLEKKLQQSTKKEKESTEAFENLGRQSFLITKLISTLRRDENQKQSEIDMQVENIKSIENEIKILQHNYSKYVVANYKYGTYTEWESVFDAASVQQAILRVEYLKRFSKKRENDLNRLNENKMILIAAKEKLLKEIELKKILTKEKIAEEKVLEKKLNERKKILTALKKDRKKLTNRINEKRKAEKQIKNLITKLVEEAEQRRREAELKVNEAPDLADTKPVKEFTQSEYNVDLSTIKFSSFAELKGKLDWPVSKGKIIGKFGENRNKSLNTITVNYGVDIKAAGDLVVKNVAEGVVSAIDWIPGYGTVIIISHKGDYRTVYGRVSEVYVNEGDQIKTGSLLAKVGESLDGNLLHFEIWNSRQNVNPELWLKKK